MASSCRCLRVRPGLAQQIFGIAEYLEGGSGYRRLLSLPMHLGGKLRNASTFLGPLALVSNLLWLPPRPGAWGALDQLVCES